MDGVETTKPKLVYKEGGVGLLTGVWATYRGYNIDVNTTVSPVTTSVPSTRGETPTNPRPIYAVLLTSLILGGSHTCNTDSRVDKCNGHVVSRRQRCTALLLIPGLRHCFRPLFHSVP